ncbi:MAG: 4Fe-4S double cluster binding domain-containing protein [Desulfomonilaceae bacterium]
MDNRELKGFARDMGADLVGVADVALLEGIQTEPEDLLKNFRRAISIGVRLSDGIINPIDDRPTPLYQQHYLKVNALLDDIALRVSQFIQDCKSVALPIPASQLLNKEHWYSYISHKAVAIAAGVGWQGKSLLVVSPDYGPRIRLVTILTDMSLRPDKPIRNRCGKCTACTEACPVQAIKGVNTTRHYSDRDEALFFEKCVERVTGNARDLPFIESPICGVCIRACPWGARKKGRRINLRNIDE